MNHDARGGDAPKPTTGDQLPGEQLSGDQLSVVISRQDLSWQRGEPLSIEELLSTVQSKSPDGRELLDLICNEVYLRQLSGESPKLEDYQKRFPEFAKQIAIQWQVDGFLDDFVASDDSTSRPAIENEDSVNDGVATKLQSIDETLKPTSPMHGIPPELLEHPSYRVERQIGRGGMGTVWLAEQLSMHRMVALKLIRPELAAKPESIARFRRELQAAARLRHPNIVTAHDAGNVGKTHFLVFEYIEGMTLAKCVESEPLSISEACAAVRDAALGLMHAHAAGLVHRDIKPGNLIRDTDGLVKVLDFGLVVEPSDASSITGENIVMGTADYISPEQANDPRLTDARSDIYSLGCTLYHLLSGRAPFKGLSPLKKLDAQRFVTAQPIPNVPKSLQEVVSKMMAKRPEDRYQTASEVVAAMTPFCSPQLPAERSNPAPATANLLSSSSRSSKSSRRAAFVTCAGGLACVLILASAWRGCIETPKDTSKSELNEGIAKNGTPKDTSKSGEMTEPSELGDGGIADIGTTQGTSKSVALTDPPDFADGELADIKIVGERLTMTAIRRPQVWLNYKQLQSDELEFIANFQVLETTAPEPIVKFIFQSEDKDSDFHEYIVQFFINKSTAQLIRTKPGREKDIIDEVPFHLEVRKPKELRFRMDENGLSVKVDGQQILKGECSRTSYHPSVAVLYCSAEFIDSRAEDVSK